jgi:hypothetical protein
MRLSITDLQPGITYAIQVRAVTSNGAASEWSNRYTFIAMQDTTPPTTPPSVTWAVSGDSFAGTWGSVTTNTTADPITITRYELELVASGTTKIISIPQTTGDNLSYALSFEDNRALFGTPRPSITMRVRAVDNKDLKSAWSSAITATNAAPGVPTSVVAVGGMNEIALSWNAPSDVDLVGYNIYNGATKLTFTPQTTYTYSTTTYTSTTLSVRAVDKFGQESTNVNANAVTPASPFVVDSTAPNVPTGLTASITNNADTVGARAAVAWTMTSPPSDLSGFYLRWRKVGDTDYSSTTFDKDARAGIIELSSAFQNYEFQIRAYDWANNYSAYSATTTATSPTNTAPSQPAAPTASVGTLQVQVTHSGLKQAGGAMESDVVRYNVYASTTTGFTESAANMLGTMQAGPAIVETFHIPATGGTATQTWYVKVVAVDRGGLTSTASPQTTAAVGLVAAANIVDATITNAKIADLAANKITAGTGFINDITVKSRLTLGDASTVGYIETYDYTASSGATGAQFSKNGIIIKTGAVEAAALKIQSSHNMLPARYADFEGYPTSYAIGAANATATVVSSKSQFNTQSLYVVATGAGCYVPMGTSLTDWNLAVEAGKTYIVSWYAFNPTGAISTPVTWWLRGQTTGSPTTGVDFAGSANTLAVNNTWTRYSTTITADPTATGKAVLYLGNLTSGATIYIDGVQIEEKIGALNTPSAWKPPGSTTISGDIIRTGSIQSNDTARIIEVYPIYAGDGSIDRYSDPVEIADPLGRPAWFINVFGAAEFSNLAIRGNAIVGNPSGTTDPGTAYPVVIVANTTSASNVINGATGGAFNSSDLGLPISGAGIPVGATITEVTATAGGTSVKISANATATATGINITVTRVKRRISSVSSADYVPGARGWTIRSDGFAEFRDLAADSVTADVLKGGIVDADHLSSYIALKSVMTIGPNITIDPDIGMTITSPNGNTVFPVGDAGITLGGDVIANSLTVIGNLAIRGLTNEIAKGSSLVISTGTTPPKTAPQVSVGWNAPNMDDGYNIRGFSPSPRAGRWMSTESIYAGGIKEYYFDGTNYVGEYGGGFNINSLGRTEVGSAMGGAVSDGNYVYILCQTNSSEKLPGTAYGRWYVYKVQWTGSAYVYIARFLHEGSDHGGNSPYEPTIGMKGSNVIVAQPTLNKALRIYEYNVAGSTGSTTVNGHVNWWTCQNPDGSTWLAPYHARGIMYGTFDFGSPRFIYMTTVGVAYTMTGAATGSGVVAMRVGTTEEFKTPENDMRGIYWDSTAGIFMTRSATKAYEHTAITDTATPFIFGNTWVRANATPSHYAAAETMLGTTRTVTVGRRQRVIVTTAPIPYLSTDPTSPDSTNIYIGKSSGAMTLNAIPRGGINTRIFTTILTGVSDTPTSPSFSAGQFGWIASVGTEPVTTGLGAELISLRGDGSGRVGPFAWDSNGQESNVTAWVTPTLNAGWTAQSGFAYRRVRDEVQFRGALSWTGSGTAVAFTLPVGFRPDFGAYFGASSNTTVSMITYVTTAGAVTTYLSAATGSWIPFGQVRYQITFP